MTKAEQINIEKRAKAIGSIFLIAVGINQYDRSVGNLQNCCTDASTVFNTVKNKEYLPMSDNSLLITSDKNPTGKQALLDQINACSAFINEHTNIVLYYSGHGCNIHDTFHFVVSDSIFPFENLISIDEITDILTRMNQGRYKSVTVLIDACQTQPKQLKGLEKQSKNFVSEYIDNARGLGIIYSCSKGEFSLNEFNKERVSVFTFLLLNALNGCTDAVDANYLTFNKLYEYIQLESRRISKANNQIKQHPQQFFWGNDIVYAYIPDNHLTTENKKISIQTYDDSFEEILYKLQYAAFLVWYEAPLIIENDDDAYSNIPSEKFIRQVCEALSREGVLDYSHCSNVLSSAFTYYYRIRKESSDALQPSFKMQIIDDVTDLYNALHDIRDKHISW